MKFVKPLIVFISVLFALSAFAQVNPELLKKAEAGDADAQFELARAYYIGKGVGKDYKKVAEWYTKAANQGNTGAQSNLGVMYYNGDGVSKNIVTGCAWMYISKNQRYSAVCDDELTQEQKTKVSDVMNELKKNIKPAQ